MKKLVFALLAGLFVVPAAAQDFPVSVTQDPRGNMVPTSVKRFHGEVADPSAASPSTIDTVDFGFTADYVQLCTRSPSGTVYIRFGSSTTNSTSVLNADTKYLTSPVSNSGAFINGVSGTAVPNGAIVFSPILTQEVSGSNGALQEKHVSRCMTQPWKTPGLTFHVVSGHATIDVNAFGR